MPPNAAADTRSRLVDAAMHLFWEKGYRQHQRRRRPARAAGANSGSLYHFFPGKQDLLLAVLERYRDGIDADAARIRHGRASTIRSSGSSRCSRATAQGIVETDCTYGCPIGSLALEIHEPDPPVREALAANFDAWAARSTLPRAAAERLPRALDRRGARRSSCSR